MADVAELGFAVHSEPIKTATDRLDKLVPAAQRAEVATDHLNRELASGSGAASKFNASISSTGNQLRSLMGAVQSFAAGFAAVFSISQLIGITNAWTDMSSRIKIAVGSTELATATMERLEAMARRTYSSLGLTAESFLLNARALTELGYSTDQQLNFTEALNNALVVSGAKGQRAESVLNAISKAMAGGALRGEELNTVIQSGGRVAQALAEGMGVATTDLRALGEQGKITSAVLYDALNSQLEKLREEADGMKYTIGDAFVIMGNSLMSFIGHMDEATGISQAVATAIIFVADNLEIVAGIVTTAGAAFAAAFGPGLVMMIGTYLVGAIKAVGVAVAANPLGALAVAIITIMGLVWTFRDAIQQAIGVDVGKIAKDAANWLIRTFLGAFEDIKSIWMNFPTMIGNAAIGAANIAIRATNSMIATAIAGINTLSASLLTNPLFNGVAQMAGVKMVAPDTGQIEEMAYIAGNSWTAFTTKVNKTAIATTDYVGQLGAAMSELSPVTEAAAVSAGELGGALGGVGGSGTGGGAAALAAEGLKEIQDAAEAAQKRMDELRSTVVDLAGSALKSFFSDIMDGKTALDALTGSLNKLADKMMDMVLDMAINGLLNSIMGGIGGSLGGVGRGLTGAATYGFTGNGVYGVPGFGGNARMSGAANLNMAPAANMNGGKIAYLQPIVNNNMADQANTKVEFDGEQLSVTIDKMVAGAIQNTGSASNKAIRNRFGVGNQVRAR